MCGRRLNEYLTCRSYCRFGDTGDVRDAELVVIDRFKFLAVSLGDNISLKNTISLKNRHFDNTFRAELDAVSLSICFKQRR